MEGSFLETVWCGHRNVVDFRCLGPREGKEIAKPCLRTVLPVGARDAGRESEGLQRPGQKFARQIREPSQYGLASTGPLDCR